MYEIVSAHCLLNCFYSAKNLCISLSYTYFRVTQYLLMSNVLACISPLICTQIKIATWCNCRCDWQRNKSMQTPWPSFSLLKYDIDIKNEVSSLQLYEHVKTFKSIWFWLKLLNVTVAVNMFVYINNFSNIFIQGCEYYHAIKRVHSLHSSIHLHVCITVYILCTCMFFYTALLFSAVSIDLFVMLMRFDTI